MHYRKFPGEVGKLLEFELIRMLTDSQNKDWYIFYKWEFKGPIFIRCKINLYRKSFWIRSYVLDTSNKKKLIRQSFFPRGEHRSVSGYFIILGWGSRIGWKNHGGKILILLEILSLVSGISLAEPLLQWLLKCSDKDSEKGRVGPARLECHDDSCGNVNLILRSLEYRGRWKNNRL